MNKSEIINEIIKVIKDYLEKEKSKDFAFSTEKFINFLNDTYKTNLTTSEDLNDLIYASDIHEDKIRKLAEKIYNQSR